MKKQVRRWGVLAMVAAMGALLAACNTVEGVGKDVKGAGQAIENAAN